MEAVTLSWGARSLLYLHEPRANGEFRRGYERGALIVDRRDGSRHITTGEVLTSSPGFVCVVDAKPIREPFVAVPVGWPNVFAETVAEETAWKR